MRPKTDKGFKISKVAIICIIGFVLAALLVVADEIFDVPALVFNAQPTPINWTEIGIELFFIFIVGTLVISVISWLDSKRQQAEESLRKVNRTLKTLSECNQILVWAANEPDLLDNICQAILKYGGYRLVWVGFVNQDEDMIIRSMAEAGFESGYFETANIACGDKEWDSHPVGVAIRTGGACVVRDILTDSELARWHTEAIHYGYNSLIALPLFNNSQTIGALQVYSPDTDAFDTEEVKLLTELANDLAYGIMSLRTRVKRQQDEEKILNLSRFPDENPDPVLRIAEDGLVLYANRNSQPLLEYWRLNTGEYVKPPLSELIKQSLAENNVLEIEVDYEKKVFSCLLTPMASAGYVNIYARDITNRKHAEEHIRNLNDVLRALRGINQLITREKDRVCLIHESCELLVETRGFLSAWILLFDENHKYISAAVAGDEQLQDFRKQLKQSNYPPCIDHILLHKDSLAICSEVVEERQDCLLGNYYTGGQGLISRLEYEGKVYGVVSVYVSTDFILDHEELDLFRELAGDIAYALASIEREASRLQGQEDLRRSEEKLRLMFEALTEGILVVGLDSKILEINNTVLQMYGTQDKDELVGKNMLQFVSELDRERFRGGVTRTMAQGSGGIVEYTLIRKDGSEFPAEMSASVLRDTSGKPAGVIAVVNDITERKKMAEQLIITDRLASIGELASGIAHELNNPLTGVIGLSELLLEREIPENISEDLEIIRSEAQRAARVVKNLLTFARKHPVSKEPVSVNEVIEKVLVLRAYEQKVSNVRVDIHLATALPKVLGDYFQLQQVFLNIIINAEYFMTEAHGKGTLTISTAQQGDYVQVSFADDGPGISKQNLGHLFTPFFTTKEVGKGTGLGLSICHGIISAHDGKIYAESELGKGTTFIIELPLNSQEKIL